MQIIMLTNSGHRHERQQHYSSPVGPYDISLMPTSGQGWKMASKNRFLPRDARQVPAVLII